MRLALPLVLAVAACASPHNAPAPVEGAPADAESLDRRRRDASERLTGLRWRSTWPSPADREHWERLHAVAEHTEVVAGDGRDDDVRAFCDAVDALAQLDALFRVGESARSRR